jgi:predicted RNA-binding protein with PIN domain
MPLIIDGYNLLHSIHQTDEDFDAISDIQLCRIVDAFLMQTKQKGEIIFDGSGPPNKSTFDNMRKLEVLFAGPSRDADTVVENKIKASTDAKRLTVVSSDRRILQAARARRAAVMKSDAFWDGLQRQLSRKKTAHEPAAKRHGLSESETEQWLRIFGLDK